MHTQDVADELVALVGQLALAEELGVARHPAPRLHPPHFLSIRVVRRDQRMPVRLLRTKPPATI